MLALAAAAVAAGCGGEEARPVSGAGAGGAATTTATDPRTTPAAPAEPRRASATPQLRRLERIFGARVGVYALDTGSGRELAYRADDRFPYASTFKALAAGAILDRVGVEGLDRTLLVDTLTNAYSPITEQRVGTRMSLRALASAAVRHSDNTAANLLLDQLGGPKGLDAWLARELGDDVTRMVRREPELNDWAPSDDRDTSTPRALARDLRALVLGDVLQRPEREQLTTWLRTNTTGATVIRAGVPKGWQVGDKTGTGATYGARNDIAVLWPPGDRPPIVLAIMTRRPGADDDHDDALIARTTRTVLAAF